MVLQFFTIFLLTVFCYSCDTTSSNLDSDSVSNNSLTTEQPEETKHLQTIVSSLRIRQSPSLKSDVVITVPEGSILLFLNEKTANKERVTLRGIEHNEPWLKIRYEKGNVEGWVYGGAVKEINSKSVEKIMSSNDVSKTANQSNKKRTSGSVDDNFFSNLICDYCTKKRIKILDNCISGFLDAMSKNEISEVVDLKNNSKKAIYVVEHIEKKKSEFLEKIYADCSVIEKVFN